MELEGIEVYPDILEDQVMDVEKRSFALDGHTLNTAIE